MPTAVHERTGPARPAEGPVLVRIEADAEGWMQGLPSVPDGLRVSVTVGDPAATAAASELAARGYDLIGFVAGRRPGAHADLLISATLRDDHPRWFAALLLVAQRVFDPRFGPVQLALQDELVAHLPSSDLDD